MFALIRAALAMESLHSNRTVTKTVVKPGFKLRVLFPELRAEITPPSENSLL